MTLKRAALTGIGIGVASYAAIAALTWARYGSWRRSGMAGTLDQFIPDPEVVELHQIRVMAPPSYTYAAAHGMSLESSPLIRAIIGVRKLALGGLKGVEQTPAKVDGGLIAECKALDWGVLMEAPGREIVMGAVTQPWVANPVFRALQADEFSMFAEPGWVKIAWNLRADPLTNRRSVFVTETRVATTDAAARAKFRNYWSFVSPGVWLIRRLMLGPVKGEAELNFRALQLVNRDPAQELGEEIR